MQVELCLWIKKYKSVYEMDPDDKPEMEIIQSDKRLDSYLDNLYRDRLSKARKARKK